MNGILVETDIIVEYLTAGPGDTPLLRQLLESVMCYTTFLQAAEIYSAAQDEDEHRTVERALFGLKILGASSRYAKTIAQALTSDGRASGHRAAIVAAMAMESQLPVLTDSYLKDFSNIAGVHLIAASSLREVAKGASFAEALATIR